MLLHRTIIWEPLAGPPHPLAARSCIEDHRRRELVRERTKERYRWLRTSYGPSRFFPAHGTVRPWQEGFGFGASKARFPPASRTFHYAHGCGQETRHGTTQKAAGPRRRPQ